MSARGVARFSVGQGLIVPVRVARSREPEHRPPLGRRALDELAPVGTERVLGPDVPAGPAWPQLDRSTGAGQEHLRRCSKADTCSQQHTSTRPAGHDATSQDGSPDTTLIVSDDARDCGHVPGNSRAAATSPAPCSVPPRCRDVPTPCAVAQSRPPRITGAVHAVSCARPVRALLPRATSQQPAAV